MLLMQRMQQKIFLLKSGKGFAENSSPLQVISLILLRSLHNIFIQKMLLFPIQMPMHVMFHIKCSTDVKLCILLLIRISDYLALLMYRCELSVNLGDTLLYITGNKKCFKTSFKIS